MSSDSRPVREADAHLEICDFCGGYIDEPNKQCPALEAGRCSP